MNRSRLLDAGLPRPLSDEDLDDETYQLMQSQLRHELLSTDDERRLLRRAHDGDRAARDRLVECNLRLVHTVARRYRGHGVPLTDLVQEGTIGLMRAIDKYDAIHDTRLSTYAIRWIRAFCQRAVQQSGVIRESPRVAWNRSLVLRTEERLGEDVSDVRLAEETGLSADWITYVKHGRHVVISLDETIRKQNHAGANDQATLRDHIPDTSMPSVEDQVLAHLADHEFILWLKQAMSEREVTILILRYGLFTEPQTLRAIAARMGVSYERIRQIESKALGKLRDILLSSPLAESGIVRDTLSRQAAGISPPPYRVRARKRPAIVPTPCQAENDASPARNPQLQLNTPALPASFDVLVGRAIRVTSAKTLNATSRRNSSTNGQRGQKGASKTHRTRKTA